MWGLRPIVGAHLAAWCFWPVWHLCHICVALVTFVCAYMIHRKVWYATGWRWKKCDVRLYVPAWTQELRAEIGERWYQSSLIHPASIWTDQWNAIYTHLGALISACRWRSRHLSCCLSTHFVKRNHVDLHTHYSASLKWISMNNKITFSI